MAARRTRSRPVAAAGPLLDDKKQPLPYLATAREVTFFVAASIAHPIQAPEVLFHSLLLTSGVRGGQKRGARRSKGRRGSHATHPRVLGWRSRHHSPTCRCQTTRVYWQ